MQHLSNREHLRKIAKTLGVRPLKICFESVEVPRAADHGPLHSKEIDVLVDRYKAGESVRQLAVVFGIHRHTVTAHLKRNDIPRRGFIRQLTDEQCVEIADLYVSGQSLNDIAGQFGVHAKTVSNELRKLHVVIRPQGKNYY